MPMPNYSELSVVVILMLALCGLLVGPFSSAGLRSNMYTIKVNHCDKKYYENRTKWYTGDWSIVPEIGVCPNGRAHFKHSSESRKIKVYSDCINFRHDKSNWKMIDEENNALGYKSDFVRGAEIWYTAKQCYVSGVIFAFIYLFLAGVGTRDHDMTIVCTCLLMMPLSFTLFVIVFMITANTDQLNTKAWTTYFFHTCEVNIVKDYGFDYLLTATVTAGVVSFGMLTLLFLAVRDTFFCGNCLSESAGNQPVQVGTDVITAEAELTSSDISMANVQVIQTVRNARDNIIRRVSDSVKSDSDSCDDNISEMPTANEVDTYNSSFRAVAHPVVDTENPPSRHL
jgi:hypothetical protein